METLTCRRTCSGTNPRSKKAVKRSQVWNTGRLAVGMGLHMLILLSGNACLVTIEGSRKRLQWENGHRIPLFPKLLRCASWRLTRVVLSEPFSYIHATPFSSYHHKRSPAVSKWLTLPSWQHAGPANFLIQPDASSKKATPALREMRPYLLDAVSGATHLAGLGHFSFLPR